MKGMGRMSMVLLGLAVLIIASSAQAGVITDWDTDWPTGDDAPTSPEVLGPETAPDGYRDYKPERAFAQSFQISEDLFSDPAGTFQLNRIYFQAQWDWNADKDFQIQIVEVDDTLADTLDTSNVVWTSETITTPAAPGGNQNRNISFDLSDSAVELSRTDGDSGYAWRLLSDEEDQGDAIFLRMSWDQNGNPYSDGRGYGEGEGNNGWGGSAGTDFRFALVGEVVPEPATMGLLAIGGLGMLLRRRK